MRKVLGRPQFARGATATAAALALALTALALALSVTPSTATTVATWTVKPGGDFSATNSGRITVKDTKTGTVVTCKPSSLTGNLKSGRGLPGAKIAPITAFSLGSCDGPGGITYVITTSASKTHPWELNAESYDTANGESTATVTGIYASWSGFGCTFTISAANSIAPGTIETTYVNSTHALKIITRSSTLHLHHVSSGCLGLWNRGDHLTISGTFTVTPSQSVTSP